VFYKSAHSKSHKLSPAESLVVHEKGDIGPRHILLVHFRLASIVTNEPDNVQGVLFISKENLHCENELLQLENLF
jgi:hypothetical protein